MSQASPVIPSVSVIVPVYNAAATISRCAHSILAQEVGDIELLLVDDGSADGSSDLCDDIAARDPRVRVIHQPNGGASAARNAGLDAARGRWIAFADADDTVCADYLSVMLLATESVVGASAQDSADDASPKSANAIVVQKKLSPKMVAACAGSLTTAHSAVHSAALSVVGADEVVDLFLKTELFRSPFPFGKLFDAAMLRRAGVRFPQGVHLGEDKIFFLRALAVADSLAVADVFRYVYNDQTDSLSKRYYTVAQEHRGYAVLRQALMAFLARSQATKDNLALAWRVAFDYNFYRCLFCTGVRIKDYSFAQICAEYDAVYTADAQEFRRFYTPQSPKNYLVRWLFLHRAYRPLVAFNRIYYLFLKYVLKGLLKV